MPNCALSWIAAFGLCAFGPGFGDQSQPDPKAFETRAVFSIDKDAMTLTSVAATIEPRPGAPGYSWLRITFYSFPFTAADRAAAMTGHLESMDARWTKQGGQSEGLQPLACRHPARRGQELESVAGRHVGARSRLHDRRQRARGEGRAAGVSVRRHAPAAQGQRIVCVRDEHPGSTQPAVRLGSRPRCSGVSEGSLRMLMRRFGSFACSLLVFAAWLGAQDGDWVTYGRDPGGERFSPLDSIRRDNVATLQVAWTFRTGDAYEPKNGRPTAFEATPLHVDGTLYLSTPVGRVIALDPVDGRQRWAFDAKVPRDKGYGDFASRGVSTWSRGSERRIFVATIDARLIALDAKTGTSDPRLRGAGHGRSPEGTAHRSDRLCGLPGHLAARRRRQHRRRGLGHRRRHVEDSSERRGARLRRDDRKTEMDLGPRPAGLDRPSGGIRGRTPAARAAPTPGR